MVAIHHMVNYLGMPAQPAPVSELRTRDADRTQQEILRAAMANTARLDVDAYGVSQRVVAWFTPDDCVVLEQ